MHSHPTQINEEFNPEAVFDPSSDKDQDKDSKKRKQLDEDAESEKKPEPPRKKFNSSIYITNLPLDVTIEEMKEVFTKYGIIMEDIATGLPRIKLYTNEKGEFKGDALVTYFKEESVKLAVDLMDDSDFRFGENSKIRVSHAVFKEKERPPSDGPKKIDKKKAQKKIQNLQKKLDWFEEEAGKKSDKFSKIVILKHMFTKQEIDEDPTLLIDLKEEVREECEKLGEVTNVVMYDHSDDGVITVRFRDTEAATKCVEKNNNRFFGGRRILAYHFDGKEKFKETKTAAEIQAEEEKRLAAFENWLEENH
ncbi:nuclear mRNA splicing factor-associated protein [Obelidium mucronatum]|nr:nuclear mRNA splicing factor-associated protein [Obelidium mucronatum]